MGNGKIYFQNIKPEEERKLEAFLAFLRQNNLYFYTLTERNEGDSKYVDINVSIKLS